MTNKQPEEQSIDDLVRMAWSPAESTGLIEHFQAQVEGALRDVEAGYLLVPGPEQSEYINRKKEVLSSHQNYLRKMHSFHDQYVRRRKE